jgi:hypothetical protein
VIQVLTSWLCTQPLLMADWGDAAKSILIMDFHPFTTAEPAGPGGPSPTLSVIAV